MNVQLCIAVTYFYDYLKQNWSQIYSKLLKIAYRGLSPPYPPPPQRGFAPVPHSGLQAAPRPPASVKYNIVSYSPDYHHNNWLYSPVAIL